VEVAGIPSPKYGEEVAAFIKVKEGQSLSEEDIFDFCRGQIARFKTPKYVFFVDEFPMTASGKIQKFKLSELGAKICKDKGIEIK
jgi:fatty-acyl-CoA synthase